MTSVTGVTLNPAIPTAGSPVTVSWNYAVDSSSNQPAVGISFSPVCGFQSGNTANQTFVVDSCGSSGPTLNGGCVVGNNIPLGTSVAAKTFTVPSGLTPGTTYYVTVGMHDYNLYANPGVSGGIVSNCASFTVPLPPPSVSLFKTAEGQSALVGGKVLFTVYYTAANTSNVVITDVVDNNFNISSVYDGGGTAGQTITWTIPGPFTAPVTGSVSFLATVKAGTPTNTIIPN